MLVTRVVEYDAGDLPGKLKRLARRCTKSTSQVCKDAGLSRAYWYTITAGERKSIPWETLESIAKGLGVTMEDLGVNGGSVAE
jgi:transcriptional regulator with XRE-family HTH domain